DAGINVCRDCAKLDCELFLEVVVDNLVLPFESFECAK
ncbi:hypothetical protein Tco_0789875, partial [Tanacetum coccineum]